jgi:Zn-dependent peptidase ImmA (M78 family)
MAVRRKHIRALVESLLEKNDVVPGAVPVEKIAKSYGIALKLDEVDDDLSGFLYRDQKTKNVIIGANKSHHPNRQRFTIAHELGHYLLHEGELVHLDSDRGAFMLNLRDSTSSKGEDNDEREANLFAAELLMPAKFLKQDLEGKDLDILGGSEFLQKIARKYKVSTEALTFRLANLGYITR